MKSVEDLLRERNYHRTSMFSGELQDIIKGVKKAFTVLAPSEKRSLIIASAIMVVIGFLTNLPALFLGQFVDTILPQNSPSFSSAVPFIVLVSIVLIVKEALTVLRKYLVENVATQSEKHVSVLLLEHVLKLDAKSVGQTQIGVLHGRMGRSVQGLVRMIKLIFLDFLPTAFAAIGALVIVFTQEQYMAGLMILVIPAGLYIVMKQIASQKGIRVSLLREKEKIDGSVVEMLGGFETIRASNTTKFEVDKVETIAEKLRSIEIKHHIHMALYDAAKYLNEAFFYVLVVSISIYFATKGMISNGDILTYSILLMSVINPLRTVHRIVDEAHENSIKINDLNDLLLSPEDISYQATGTRAPIEASLPIEVKDLSFQYSEVRILKGISFTIKKGEKVGLVGASGCGKSTLIKILLRLHHGYQGNIQLYGTDLRSFSRQDIADLIAYVPQQPFIFSGNIRENLLYGAKRDFSEEELYAVLAKVNLKEEIEVLGGLSAFVSERGNNLSGGQKQRLAIARLLLKKPQLVILDEATAALDNNNEAIVQNNINVAFNDVAVIVIAHRLSTLRNMDNILVFKDGTIVQEGSYDELENQDGLFKQFLNDGKQK